VDWVGRVSLFAYCSVDFVVGAVDGWHCEGVGGSGTDLDSYVLGRVGGLAFFDWD
jgi:hypothetical protein